MTEKEIETLTRETFERVCARLAFWFEHGLSLDEYIDTVNTPDEDIIEAYKAQGDFFEYGLSFDFKPADGHTDGHYVYLITWGGPQYEFRFYPGYVEFWYLDWFTGYGINVSDNETVKTLRSNLEDCQSIDFDSKDPYDLYSSEHESSQELIKWA